VSIFSKTTKESLRALFFITNLSVASCTYIPLTHIPATMPGLPADIPFTPLPVARWIAEGPTYPLAMAICLARDCAYPLAVGLFETSDDPGKILKNSHSFIESLGRSKNARSNPAASLQIHPLHQSLSGYALSGYEGIIASNTGKSAYIIMLAWPYEGKTRYVLVVGANREAALSTAMHIAKLAQE
jgi:hypothetical protein